MTAPLNPLPAQDTAEVLNRMFTGRVTGQPAMGYAPIEASVVSATATQVVVAVTGFSSSAGFTCYYEPRWYWNGSANVRAEPPPGATCIICFPPNDPNGYGWAISFRGWPTQ